MRFEKSKIEGCFVIYPNKNIDERGHFSRTYCENEFKSMNLNIVWPQSNSSFNLKKGTIRGLHLQVSPSEETKLIRCTSGSVFDVLVDARKDSSTYGSWIGITLSEQNLVSIYAPEGIAHGFQTLEDNSELFYMHSRAHSSEHSTGFSVYDPNLKIDWPEPITMISKQDSGWKNLREGVK